MRGETGKSRTLGLPEAVRTATPSVRLPFPGRKGSSAAAGRAGGAKKKTPARLEFQRKEEGRADRRNDPRSPGGKSPSGISELPPSLNNQESRFPSSLQRTPFPGRLGAGAGLRHGNPRARSQRSFGLPSRRPLPPRRQMAASQREGGVKRGGRRLLQRKAGGPHKKRQRGTGFAVFG